MTDMKTEPVACMIRSRSLIAQASIAVDGKDHFSAWSEWAPNSIEYGRAVTDPIRNNPVCYEMELLFKEQPAPLKIGSGVTVENIGFGSEQERKPYLVFGGGGFLTEVNLIDVSLVSKRQAHTIADLEAIGVRVEQPAPVAWVECSPAWLKAGGDCATAPRICVGREGISHLHPAHSSAEQPAPVSMVMPERELYTKYLVGVIPHNANEVNAYKDGWNTCLEEVARLNGVKP